MSKTALRLVARMKRDWLHHGRRPSGLCGAGEIFILTLVEYMKVFMSEEYVSLSYSTINILFTHEKSLKYGTLVVLLCPLL